VAGTSAILDEWERRQLVDLRWLAYMPATTFHETDSTMQPIFEKGQRSYFDKYETGAKKGAELGNTKPGDGYLYRGRGFVQLTGRANYEKMHVILGVDLTSNPDPAPAPANAAAIMFEGMSRGTLHRQEAGGLLQQSDERLQPRVWHLFMQDGYLGQSFWEGGIINGWGGSIGGAADDDPIRDGMLYPATDADRQADDWELYEA
jgi:hypothetical protein